MLRSPRRSGLIVDGRYVFTTPLRAEKGSTRSAPAATTNKVLSELSSCSSKGKPKRHRKLCKHDSDESRTSMIYASNQTLHINDTIVIGDGNELIGNNNKAIGDYNILQGTRCRAVGRNNAVRGRLASAIGCGNTVKGPGSSLIEFEKKKLTCSDRIRPTPTTPRWLDAKKESHIRSISMNK